AAREKHMDVKAQVAAGDAPALQLTSGLRPLISGCAASRATANPSSLPRAGDGWRGPWQFRRALRPCVPLMPERRRGPLRPRRRRNYLALSDWRTQPAHLGRDFVSRAPAPATSGVANLQARRAPISLPVLRWRRPQQLRWKMEDWRWEMALGTTANWTRWKSPLHLLGVNGCRLRHSESRYRSARFLASPATARALVWCPLPNTRCATGLAEPDAISDSLPPPLQKQ